MERETAEHVVVDAVAFFKNIQLQNFAKNVHTIHSVVKEIRDAKTRERLSVLPYELRFREPSAESIQFVSEFARKAGEYKSLSPVDIQVIALAYQLTKEHVGTDHLKVMPDKKMTFTSNRKPLEKSTEIVGFYYPQKDDNSTSVPAGDGDVPLDLTELNIDEERKVTSTTDASNQQENCQTRAGNDSSMVPTDSDEKIDHGADGSGTHLGVDGSECIHVGKLDKVQQDVTNEVSERVKDLADDASRDGSTASKEMETDEAEAKNRNIGESVVGEESLEEMDGGHERTDQLEEVGEGRDAEGLEEIGEDGGKEEVEDDEGFDDAEDDEVGWITPHNLQKAKDDMRKDILDSLDGVKVACLTTDFAMQNVLIQIGIPVLSVEGMVIKKAKSFALRCFACFKVTSDTSKTFCPKCGNKTLNKVSVMVDGEGNTHYHMSRRRGYKIGELRQSLPMPKGGKHTVNPLVCEDQPQSQSRVSRKARIRNNVFDPDYVAQNSPFVTRDVTSRSALLGVGRKQQKKRGKKK